MDHLRRWIQNPKFILLACLGAIILFVGGIILFAGWLISKPKTQPLPNVLSLQDNWELLESGGHDWQSDAYLNRITFDVNESLPYKIEATYLSKSTPHQTYHIDINEWGKVFHTGRDATYPMRQSAKLPIKREDWTIGSMQAWGLFLKNSTINTCATQRDEHVTIYMDLDRTGSGRLAWELFLGDCPLHGVAHFYDLDAKTGETVGYFE